MSCVMPSAGTGAVHLAETGILCQHDRSREIAHPADVRGKHLFRRKIEQDFNPVCIAPAPFESQILAGDCGKFFSVQPEHRLPFHQQGMRKRTVTDSGSCMRV